MMVHVSEFLPPGLFLTSCPMALALALAVESIWEINQWLEALFVCIDLS